MNTEIIRTLVKHNRAWGKAVKSINPSFFINQANIQVPLAMVIGCSDSRVPFTTISDSAPVLNNDLRIGRFIYLEKYCKCYQ